MTQRIAKITRVPPAHGRGSIMLHDETGRCIGLLTLLQTDNIEAHAALLDQVEAAITGESERISPSVIERVLKSLEDSFNSEGYPLSDYIKGKIAAIRNVRTILLDE